METDELVDRFPGNFNRAGAVVDFNTAVHEESSTYGDSGDFDDPELAAVQTHGRESGEVVFKGEKLRFWRLEDVELVWVLERRSGVMRNDGFQERPFIVIVGGRNGELGLRNRTQY